MPGDDQSCDEWRVSFDVTCFVKRCPSISPEQIVMRVERHIRNIIMGDNPNNADAVVFPLIGNIDARPNQWITASKPDD